MGGTSRRLSTLTSDPPLGAAVHFISVVSPRTQENRGLGAGQGWKDRGPRPHEQQALAEASGGRAQ